MFNNTPRSHINGSDSDVQPKQFQYSRIGRASKSALQLDFWIDQAGEYHSKPHQQYCFDKFESTQWIQLFYTVLNSAEIELHDHTIHLAEGDLIIIPSHHPFCYKTEQLHQFHWLAIAGEWPRAWGLDPRVQHMPIGINEELITHFKTVCELLIAQPVGYQLQSLSVFYAMLGCINAS